MVNADRWRIRGKDESLDTNCSPLLQQPVEQTPTSQTIDGQQVPGCDAKQSPQLFSIKKDKEEHPLLEDVNTCHTEREDAHNVDGQELNLVYAGTFGMPLVKDGCLSVCLMGKRRERLTSTQGRPNTGHHLSASMKREEDQQKEVNRTTEREDFLWIGFHASDEWAKRISWLCHISLSHMRFYMSSRCLVALKSSWDDNKSSTYLLRKGRSGWISFHVISLLGSQRIRLSNGSIILNALLVIGRLGYDSVSCYGIHACRPHTFHIRVTKHSGVISSVHRLQVRQVGEARCESSEPIPCYD
ncbi:hypothetical protein M514_13068 [Trichuris suis]|uniref:Uncharacterized protein n=1 Tax=Trichuris suis TaxID=68888 RepID=A0A085N1A3_9BILA|nr:hypothetical protein M514_13068 [Trichuris suis]